MKKEKGFTLLEMLVYVAILSLVVAMVLGLFLWVVRAQVRVAAAKEVVESTRIVLTILENEIKEAQSIYTPTSFSAPPQISFETRRNPPPDEDSTYVDFFLCGTRLCVKRESQSPLALTPENILIQNLSFEHIQTGSATPSVQVIFDAVYDNPGNRPELQVQVRVQTTIAQRSY